MQTLVLAEISRGQVDALDINRSYLDYLNMRAEKKGLSDNIRTVVGSMQELPYVEGSFDLIWSEGAVCIMGFREGLSYWKEFLKVGGYIGVTEISWLSEDPSEDAIEFWGMEYPDMGTIEENKEVISNLGFECTGTFVLPENAWWNAYYHPLEMRVEELKKEYSENSAALEILEMIKSEISLYRNYSDDYGYVFYLMRKK